MSIVQSRAFRIPFKGQMAASGGSNKDGELVLMPFMDAINHNYRNNVSSHMLKNTVKGRSISEETKRSHLKA